MSQAVAEKMQLRVVLLEETGKWDEAIRERAGRIFAAYLLDAARAANCVEITPSFELTYLYSTTTKGREDDELQEIILRDGAGEGHMYVHCKVIDALPKSRVYSRDGLPFERPGSEDDTYEELFEQCVEHFKGNVVIDLPVGEPGMYQDDSGAEPEPAAEASRRGFRP